MKQLLFLIFILPFYLHSQDFEVDTYHPNNYEHQISKQKNIILKKDVKYEIKVEGTFSPWGITSWVDPCGDYENRPMYPSSNQAKTYAGHDFFYSFGYPNDCKNMEFPRTINPFEFSMDEGKTWFFQKRPAYQKNHIYHFQITGKGNELWIKHRDKHSSDNNGIIKISIKEIKKNEEIIVEKEVEKKIIPKATNISFNISPNPSQGKLNLEFDDQDFSGNAIIYDAQGKLMKEVKINGNQIIYFSDIPSGVYFIKVIGNNGNSETLKFINIQPIT